MATNEIINLKIMGQVVGLRQIRQQFKQLRNESLQLKQATTGVKKNFGDISKGVRKDQIEESLKRARVEAQRFKAEWLSMMFFGMALQRTFGGILTSAFQTFKKVTEGTDRANNAITRLGAAWEFFKFSLIDALMATPFFQNLITGAITLIDKFNALGDEERGVIGGAIAGLAALGGLMATAGIIKLGIDGVNQITPQLENTKFNVKSILKGAGAIALSLFLADDAFDALESGDFGTSLMKALEAGIAGFAAFKFLKGKAGGGAALALLFTLEFVQSALFAQVFSNILLGLVALFETIFINQIKKQWLGLILLLKTSFASLLTVAASLAAFLGKDSLAASFRESATQMRADVANLKSDIEQLNFANSFQKSFAQKKANFQAGGGASALESFMEQVFGLKALNVGQPSSYGQGGQSNHVPASQSGLPASFEQGTIININQLSVDQLTTEEQLASFVDKEVSLNMSRS